MDIHPSSRSFIWVMGGFIKSLGVGVMDWSMWTGQRQTLVLTAWNGSTASTVASQARTGTLWGATRGWLVFALSGGDETVLVEIYGSTEPAAFPSCESRHLKKYIFWVFLNQLWFYLIHADWVRHWIRAFQKTFIHHRALSLNMSLTGIIVIVKKNTNDNDGRDTFPLSPSYLSISPLLFTPQDKH